MNLRHAAAHTLRAECCALILLLAGPVIFRWTIDSLKTPNRRRRGVVLLLGGTAMVRAGVAALFSI